MRRAIFFSLYFLALLMIGFFMGYYSAVGTLPVPFLKSDILPPPSNTSQTFSDISSFISNDTTDKYLYGEGMNCVDYALTVSRNAEWEGISSVIVKIDFDEGNAHAVLLFPTEDKGWVFIDPQTDKVINLKVGGIYDSRKVVQLSVLTFAWEPLENFLNETQY